LYYEPSQGTILRIACNFPVKNGRNEDPSLREEHFLLEWMGTDRDSGKGEAPLEVGKVIPVASLPLIVGKPDPVLAVLLNGIHQIVRHFNQVLRR
jgi:hypothetical protein